MVTTPNAGDKGGLGDIGNIDNLVTLITALQASDVHTNTANTFTSAQTVANTFKIQDPATAESVNFDYVASTDILTLTNSAGANMLVTLSASSAAQVNLSCSGAKTDEKNWAINADHQATEGRLRVLVRNDALNSATALLTVDRTSTTINSATWIATTHAFTGAMTVSGDVTPSGNVVMGVAAKGLVLKQGANGNVGTFTANGATPVTVSNTNVAITDAIIISLNAVGGTVGVQPHVATITAATGFTVVCTAADTSTYNYALIKNAA